MFSVSVWCCVCAIQSVCVGYVWSMVCVGYGVCVSLFSLSIWCSVFQWSYLSVGFSASVGYNVHAVQCSCILCACNSVSMWGMVCVSR